VTDSHWSARDALLFLPRLVKLMGRLIADPEVSKLDKGLLVAALGYVASPLDVIPDFIPVIGEIDDLYLVALVCLRLVNRAGAERVRAAWDGPEDIIAVLEQVNRVAVGFLPARVRRVIERSVGRGDLGGLGGGARPSAGDSSPSA
jgi:uncharacterized membrane protein YkvA (DUF1232 family)